MKSKVVITSSALLLVCATMAKGDSPAASKNRIGESPARRAAQRGLAFLERATPAWQKQHQCYGCHVQAVTMQALSVGKTHGYAIDAGALDAVLAGLTTLSGGARSEHGLSHQGGQEPADAKSYGGAALAAFDHFVSDRARSDLLGTAEALLEHQREDGSVHPEVARFPVSPSAVHSTYRAVQTWRQAFARTADDAWRAPLRKGEAFLAASARALLEAKAQAGLQDLNYAALGLIEAGASQSEDTVAALREVLLARQEKDGGWSFSSGSSDAYATGQTLYTLRVLGMADADRAVHRGTAWLVEHQQRDGGWSQRGSGKAEAMWAVLGLVSIDVASIEVAGIEDGARLAPVHQLRATAKDNHDQGIASLEVRVDDVPLRRVASDRLSFEWSTSNLEPGLHLVDFVATTKKGTRATRRLAVYSGDFFLTDVGSRFEDGGTSFALRSLADAKNGQVRLRIYRDRELLHETIRTSEHGPMRFFWNGSTRARSKAAAGRHRAELSYVDPHGRARHTVQHEFVHDTRDKQRQSYGDLQGRLEGEGRSLANTWVELVDRSGNVVQRVQSTRSGQYRFKNVDQGQYRLRVRKRGFRAFDADVAVEKGREAEANVSL